MENLTHKSLNSELLLEKLTSLSPLRNYLVAFSGGMDSHVLLHLLSTLKQKNPEISVRAVHIHHGLQAAADSWPKHCQAVCDDLAIQLELIYLNLKIKPRESLEAVARKGRYQALLGTLQKDEILLTAHHQRDQAETLLLQLFRGAGVQGLAAMPLLLNTDKGLHIRPLLDESYPSLQAYARENQLNFIEDPSNKDDHFERNFLRNQILPQLREHWQGLDKTLSRSANIQAETKVLLEQMAEQLYKECANTATKLGTTNTLSVKCLLGLTKEQQRLLIRYWISQKGFVVPSQKKLNTILNEVLLAKEDAQPLVTWQGVEVRRFKQQLYCDASLTVHDNSQCINWDGLTPLTLDSIGVTIRPEVLVDTDLVQGEPLTIRFRQGGERLRLINKGNSQGLKQYLNELAIPPWLRDRLPLIYCGDQLIKVIT